MSADSSGNGTRRRNGHRLNAFRPTIPQGHFGGGFRGSQIQMFGEAVTQLDRLAPIRPLIPHADSSGNGYRQITIRPSIPQGVLGGGGGGHKFKSLGKLSNNWTNWHQIWYMSVDSSGNGHRLNTSRLSIPQGAFWGGG